MKKKKESATEESKPKKRTGKQFSSEYQPPQKWTEEKSLQLGNDLINWLKAKDEDGNDKGNIFFEEFLVIEKDLYPDLITYLRDKFSSFSDLLKKAEKIQEIKLAKYGTADRLNASMTKFVLINNHGWRDKQEITGKDGKDFQPIQVTGITVT